MRLQKYIKPELVFPDIVADDRRELNEQIIRRFKDLNPTLDADRLRDDLNTQDRVACTGGDCIIGVPNAFVDGLPETICYVVRVSPGDPEATLKEIRIGFFVFSPPDKSTEHLRLIARISRFACHSNFCCDLAMIETAEKLYDRIVQEDEEHV